MVFLVAIAFILLGFPAYFFALYPNWLNIDGSFILASSAKRRIFEITSAVRGSSSTKGKKILPRCCEGTASTWSAP